MSILDISQRPENCATILDLFNASVQGLSLMDLLPAVHERARRIFPKDLGPESKPSYLPMYTSVPNNLIVDLAAAL